MAEGSGLLNRRRDKISTEGSNPSLSAIIVSLLLPNDIDLSPRKFFEENMPNDITSTQAGRAAETIKELSLEGAQ